MSSDDDLQINYTDDALPAKSKDSWPDVDLLKKPKAKRLPPPAPPRGFGFGMAIVWCLAYFGVSQVLAGLLFGVPLVSVAYLILEDKYLELDPKERLEAIEQEPLYQQMLMASVIIAHLVGLLFAWFMLRYLCGKRWRSKIAFTKPPAPVHATLVVIGLVAMFALVVGLDVVVAKYVPNTQDLLDAARIKIKWGGAEKLVPLLQATPLWLGILAVAIMPAINEELWCRGYLNHGMASRYEVWVVVLLTSFLFGCLHTDPRQGFAAMLLGIVIHCAYLATRSMWVAMGIHAANNGIQVLHANEKANLPLLKPFEDLFEYTPTIFLSSAAVLLVAVVYAMWQTRCHIAVKGEEEVRYWQPVGPASAEVPPLDAPMKVAHEPLSLLSMAVVLVGAIQFALVVAFA